ncbi:hypothetical protein L665_03630 [Ralstonia solanacearum SD54]|nr:hypothetical protein F504_2466 [Ralstonia pseudosolanacearum FQY_4]ANH32207.1 hypothetical protein A3768_1038 [Ralstonia solanacearum]ESS47247.1 hypothetical protein L665_03630 [Ralstonia solanacearum SD54]
MHAGSVRRAERHAGSIGAARFPMRDDVSEMQTKRVDIRFFPDACPQT